MMGPLSGAASPSLVATRLRRDRRVIGICTLQSVACGRSAEATQRKRKTNDPPANQPTLKAFWNRPHSTASGNSRDGGDIPPSASLNDTRPQKGPCRLIRMRSVRHFDAIIQIRFTRCWRKLSWHLHNASGLRRDELCAWRVCRRASRS